MRLFIQFSKIMELLQSIEQDGRFFLYEHEACDLLRHLGSETLPRVMPLLRGTRPSDEDLMSLPGDKVVMKIMSPTIVHKSGLGGVRIVDKTPAKIRSTWRKMTTECAADYARWLERKPVLRPHPYKGLDDEELIKAISRDIKGVLLCEYMPLQTDTFGLELLVGVRRTREFGMIINAGLGGTDTELFAENFQKGKAVVAASTVLTDGEAFFDLFRTTIAYQKLAGAFRGHTRVVTDEQLIECFSSFIAMANFFSPENSGSPFVIEEMEVNPFAFDDFLMVPLDAMCRFSRNKPNNEDLPRPLSKVNALLHPGSIAILGVSARKMNFGRTILRNILANGFERSNLYVIRPDMDDIDGVPCVQDITSLPGRPDLVVIAVDARQVPDVAGTIIDQDAAEAVILVSGGLGETSGSEDRSQALVNRIADARRKAPGSCPVFLGGNSMGVISHPGRYDALFNSEAKFPRKRGERTRNTALISQSGAFMVTRMNKLDIIDPAYMVSLGNQTDLTVTDLLEAMNTMPGIEVIAVYIEGFKPLDGQLFCTAVRDAVLQGKEIIFYKAGKTPEGKLATSGHTASVAGDYMVCESCVRQAGAAVASSFTEFNELFVLAATLHPKAVQGKRLAGVSSAGFEVVGIADSLVGEDYTLTFAPLERSTRHRIKRILERSNLGGLVEVKNPIDINPASDDRMHESITRAFLQDPNVDALVLCLTPLAPYLQTLPEGMVPDESLHSQDGVVQLISALFREEKKPFVVVVDGGKLYDPFVELLETNGLPVFHSADQAVTAFAKYLEARLHMAHIRDSRMRLTPLLPGSPTS